MGERLQMLLQHLGLNSARFAELIDTQPSAISHLISGRNKPSFDLLSKILTRYPELDPRWLILGEGEMFKNPPAVTARESNIFSEEDIPLDLADSPEDIPLPINEYLFPAQDKETPDVPVDISTSTDVSVENKIPVTSIGTSNAPEIKSVIIFYKDGTFESYNHK